MDINFTNLNDLAHKILQEDLCKSLDIVDDHMDALTQVNCNGVTFLASVFCKAIDEGNIIFCQKHLTHLFSSNKEDRIHVGKHAVHKNMSLEHLKILMEHDFNARDEKQQKPSDCMSVLISVAGICAQQERWDLIEWMVSGLDDQNDLEYLFLCCHFFNANTYQYIDVPLDPISVLCLGEDPCTRLDFHLSQATCDNFINYGLQKIECALTDPTLDRDWRILYTLCTHVYHQRIKNLSADLHKTEVIDVVQNPEHYYVVNHIIELAFFYNTVHAAHVLLDVFLVGDNVFLAPNMVQHMIWRNTPVYISSQYVGTRAATWALPFAVAANCKEMGLLLLDIGVDWSETIKWDSIDHYHEKFPMMGKGEKEHKKRDVRLTQWISEYEKSVLEIELDLIRGVDAQRKI